MARRLLNLLTALSLLLCVAACVLWVRSYWRHDVLRWPTARGFDKLMSNRGEFHFITSRDPSPAPWARPPGIRYEQDSVSHYGSMRGFRSPGLTVHFAGVGFSSHTWRYSHGSDTWVQVPSWAVAGALAVLPLAGAARTRARRRRHTAGLCPECGYDLRATRDRCPECGGVAGRAAG